MDDLCLAVLQLQKPAQALLSMVVRSVTGVQVVYSQENLEISTDGIGVSCVKTKNTA